jgi:uroporphyrinogen-III synthase
MASENSDSGFAGLRVAAFESRLAGEMTRLIARYGGRPLVAPSMREVPLSHNSAILEFGERLLAGDLDMVILLTGVGTRFMLEVLDTRWPREQSLASLAKTILVARGPKPIAVLREQGLQPTVAVPEPNTSKDLIETLDHWKQPLRDMAVAVQEYGISNTALLEALQTRGAKVLRVPVYRWALPEDTGPLKQAVQAILQGEIEVVLFTNAAQVDHLLRIAQEVNAVEALRQALQKVVVASVGPTAAEHLRECGLTVDLEPSHAKMGTLVKEASEQARLLLARKRAGPL